MSYFYTNSLYARGDRLSLNIELMVWECLLKFLASEALPHKIMNFIDLFPSLIIFTNLNYVVCLVNVYTVVPNDNN
ncbi:hypothetical protein CW304_10390 [Bacillus sp. UFRGS-B20]|nr:hypothetical protein CW304_10390 [Bacillus sp. UFRGS-B20]